MTERLTTPKYLTEQLARNAVDAVLDATVRNEKMRYFFKSPGCHIAVLIPCRASVTTERPHVRVPDASADPFFLCEHSEGKRPTWHHAYDKIARNKAEQLWRGRNTDGNTASVPHLLFPGDTPFWGGVKRHGIVVACSGYDPWLDQMISGMIADMIKGLAHHAFMHGDDVKAERVFLA